jgi:hypothetical protein
MLPQQRAPDGEAAMERLFDGFLAAHRVNLDAEPTPDALRAMQRLLDGVPDRWRDADLAWWPRTAIEMWAGPFAQEASWREDNRRLSNGEEVSRIAGLAMASEQPVDFCGYWQRHIGD